MTNSGTGINIVVPKCRSYKFLNNVGFFIGSSSRSDSTDRINTILALDIFKTFCCEFNSFFPLYFFPFVRYFISNHWFHNSILMFRIAPCKPSFDAAVPFVSFAIFVGNHSDNIVIFYFSFK